MKTFVKINSIIAAVGLILALIGFIWTANSWRNLPSFATASYEETVDAQKWNNADTLEIDAGFASLHIMKGKTVKLVADEVPESLAAHLTANGNTISLRSGTISGIDLIKSSGINFNSAGTYTLYIPDYIENLKVNFCFGELKITDIYAQNADIVLSYSDSELSVGVTDNIDINASFGDTDIELLSRECNTFSLTSSFGDCDVKNARITEYANIENSFGDLDIQLLGNDYNIDSDNSFGDCSIDGSRSGGKTKIDINNSFGDTNVYTDDVLNFND